MTTHSGGVPHCAQLGDGVADRLEVGVIEAERGGRDDGLVADAHGLESGLGPCRRTYLRSADDGRNPTIGVSDVKECLNGTGPLIHWADGISRGQCDPCFGSIAHCRMAVSREHDGLVTTQCEIAEGVRRIFLEEPTQAQLIGQAHHGDVALRSQHDDKSGHQHEGEKEGDHFLHPVRRRGSRCNFGTISANDPTDNAHQPVTRPSDTAGQGDQQPANKAGRQQPANEDGDGLAEIGPNCVCRKVLSMSQQGDEDPAD